MLGDDDRRIRGTRKIDQTRDRENKSVDTGEEDAGSDEETTDTELLVKRPAAGADQQRLHEEQPHPRRRQDATANLNEGDSHTASAIGTGYDSNLEHKGRGRSRRRQGRFRPEAAFFVLMMPVLISILMN